MWLVCLLAFATPEAKRLYKEATVRYDVGDFEGALNGYTAAYEQDQRPELLFNIGQCHKQLGHYTKAIFYFDAFLRNAAKSEHRALAENLRAECEAARAAQPRAVVVPRVTTTQAPPPPKPVYKQWWFWTAIGGALAVAAGTTAIVLATTQQPLPGGSLGTIVGP